MALWIFLAVGVALLALAGKAKRAGKSGTESGPRRVDIPHYLEPDEHECPKCGARFRQNVMACPRCGTAFNGTEENDLEFIEEMEIWDGDDD